jgi:hypothetical protein
MRLTPLAGFGPALSSLLMRGFLLDRDITYLPKQVIKINIDFMPEQV